MINIAFNLQRDIFASVLECIFIALTTYRVFTASQKTSNASNKQICGNKNNGIYCTNPLIIHVSTII